jgi:hypothetical protein
VLWEIPAGADPVPLFFDIEHIFCIDDTIVLLPLAAALSVAVVVFPVVVAFLLVEVAWEEEDNV